MRKVNLLIGALIIVGAMATSARAVPLPVPPLVPTVMGESHLTSFTAPGSSVSIDWIVQPSATYVGAFDYLYQLENTATAPLVAFNVTFGGGSVIAGSAGVSAGDDLDLLTFHPAHGPLAGELEPFTFAPLASVSTTVTATGVSWTFLGLPVGSESNTLIFSSFLPPAYGNAVAQDSTPPSPWGSLAPLGNPVPVPTPEPMTLFLLGSGLVGMGWFGRKKVKGSADEEA